jgi:hypothetical protein
VDRPTVITILRDTELFRSVPDAALAALAASCLEAHRREAGDALPVPRGRPDRAA